MCADCNLPHHLLFPQKDTCRVFNLNRLLQPPFSSDSVDLVHLMSITPFTISLDSVNDPELAVSSKREFSIDRLKGPKCSCNIVLLVLLPGNVQPNPGPNATGVQVLRPKPIIKQGRVLALSIQMCTVYLPQWT